MSQTPLRVAVSGCHRMLLRDLTNHNFAAAFHAVPETEIVAVFDYGKETREEFATFWQDVWNGQTYDDYDRMLKEVQPDLLCVATRQTMHADQIEVAIKAGVRGILCDKPLATTLSEMDRIVAACKNVPLVFGLDRRWTNTYLHIRETIASGIVGPVTSLVAYGLPNTINHGCHWYDAMLALLNDPEPVWVSGFLEDVSDEPPNSRRRMDPSCCAQIGMDNGVVAYITPTGPKKPGFEIVGETGRLTLLADATEAYLWQESSTSFRTLDLPEPEENWPPGPAMAQDLVQAVQQGNRTACDIDQARKATEIGFAIHVSSTQNGAKTHLPAVDRSLQVESYPWGNE